MSPDSPELDELSREIGGRLVPDLDESQIITADEVFADLDDATRSANLDEDDLIRSDDDDDDELDEDEMEDDDLDDLAADAEEFDEEDDEDDAERAVYPDDDTILRAMDPDGEEFRKYWTRGKGLRKWLGRPREWTTLKNHLRKYVGEERAKRIATRWFFRVKGFYPGSDLHRVEKGKPPRGNRVGPG